MEPIVIWDELIKSSCSKEEIAFRLRKVYGENSPSLAEIIMNSHCPHRCLHCIYPPDYDQHNRNMEWARWQSAFNSIYKVLGLKRFILNGRALTEEIVGAIGYLKENFSDVKVGLISDGVSIAPFVDDLIQAPPDWLDISVDGLESDHDRQRNHPGAFRETLDILKRLKQSNSLTRINILSCLTTINSGSIPQMIRYLNEEGFMNFFVTPVSVVNGHRPSPELQLQNGAFIRWMHTLLETVSTLNDSWVEVDIFDTKYAKGIISIEPEFSSQFEYDHLQMEMEFGNNEFHLSYYPYSLTGVRELILNSNGDIIPTNVMAMGRIPGQMIFGNILDIGKKGFEILANMPAFSYYLEEFLREKEAFGQRRGKDNGNFKHGQQRKRKTFQVETREGRKKRYKTSEP